LVANLSAALMDMPAAAERRRIEEEVAQRYGSRTNYFQRAGTLVQPQEVRTEQSGDRVFIRWNSALAGADPLRSYRIYAGDRLLLTLPFRPQTTLAPLSVSLPASEIDGQIRVEAAT